MFRTCVSGQPCRIQISVRWSRKIDSVRPHEEFRQLCSLLASARNPRAYAAYSVHVGLFLPATQSFMDRLARDVPFSPDLLSAFDSPVIEKVIHIFTGPAQALRCFSNGHCVCVFHFE